MRPEVNVQRLQVTWERCYGAEDLAWNLSNRAFSLALPMGHLMRGEFFSFPFLATDSQAVRGHSSVHSLGRVHFLFFGENDGLRSAHLGMYGAVSTVPLLKLALLQLSRVDMNGLPFNAGVSYE
jgi:hypothetical protein